MKYDEKILLEMLDIAIDLLNENDICCYCKSFGNCRFQNEWICKSRLFDGLLKKAEKNLEK